VGQLIELAQASKVPMGIEWLDVLNEKPSPPQHMRRVTLRQILYSILRQYPGYTFELNNGVIEVFATRLARDEKNFLNIRIPQFHLDRVNLYQASYELGNAIRDVVQPRPGYGGGFGQPPNPRTGFDVSNISLVTHNLAVRGVLDRIAAVQGNAVWVVRLKQSQMMSNGRFYAQTVSAMNKEAALDFQWEFIRLKDLTSK